MLFRSDPNNLLIFAESLSDMYVETFIMMLLQENCR